MTRVSKDEHVSPARPDGEVPIGEIGQPLPFPVFAVDELHRPKGLLLPLYTDDGVHSLGPIPPS